jgi:PAS domain S-box-containing protein
VTWLVAGCTLLVAAALAGYAVGASRGQEPARGQLLEFYRGILNQTNSLIIATDANGIVRGVNPSAAAAIGCTEDEIVGRMSVTAFVDPDALRARAAQLSIDRGQPVRSPVDAMLVVARETGQEEREWRFRRHDGSVLPVMAHTTALRDRGGNLTGYALVATDISAHVEQEVALEEARAAAERASRAKSEFLSNMSHELRTPLNSVIGFTSLLLKNKHGNLTTPDLLYLQRVSANARHLLGLINTILDLSKVEAGRVDLVVEPVDVGTLVRETLGELEAQALARGTRLVADVPPGVAMLDTDAAKLKQVIINLAANAIKFSERGTVTVRVATDAAGRPTRIDVEDTGIGIPADKLESIFEPFDQGAEGTSRQYGGTGLGLTITRALARRMGFDIRVTSAVGVGSTFSVVINPAPASTITLVAAPAARAPRHDEATALPVAEEIPAVAAAGGLPAPARRGTLKVVRSDGGARPSA